VENIAKSFSCATFLTHAVCFKCKQHTSANVVQSCRIWNIHGGQKKRTPILFLGCPLFLDHPVQRNDLVL